MPSQKSFDSNEPSVSTAWSTERTPVDSQSHSGVCTVIAGSSTTQTGTIPPGFIALFQLDAFVGGTGQRVEFAAR